MAALLPTTMCGRGARTRKRGLAKQGDRRCRGDLSRRSVASATVAAIAGLATSCKLQRLQTFSASTVPASALRRGPVGSVQAVPHLLQPARWAARGIGPKVAQIGARSTPQRATAASYGEEATPEEAHHSSIIGRILGVLGFLAWWSSEPPPAQAEETMAIASAAVSSGQAACPKALAEAISGVLGAPVLRSATGNLPTALNAGPREVDLQVAVETKPDIICSTDNDEVTHAASDTTFPGDAEALVPQVGEKQQEEQEEEQQEQEDKMEEEQEEVSTPDDDQQFPQPDVPGLANANLVVKVSTEPKQTVAEASRQPGAELLMEQPCGTILGLMAQDGWEVKCVDEARGEFELKLPSVRYEFPMGVVSIPQPRFTCSVRDSIRHSGPYRERLEGDLVLQNGEGLLTVEPRFLGKISISAAGWARCRVGQEGDAVQMVAEVELGLQIPKVPGLTSIMDYFVNAYANTSTQDCTRALAKGADKLFREEA